MAPVRWATPGICVACGVAAEVQTGEPRAYVGHRYAVAWQEVTAALWGVALKPVERNDVYRLALAAVARFSPELVDLFVLVTPAEVRETVETVHFEWALVGDAAPVLVPRAPR